MHHLDLILTLTGGLATALMLGYLTHRLGLSPIVGYLVGGIVIGPHTPGFVANQALAEQLAEMGVILLMFGVGLQFHLTELLAVRHVAIPGAVGRRADHYRRVWGLHPRGPIVSPGHGSPGRPGHRVVLCALRHAPASLAHVSPHIAAAPSTARAGDSAPAHLHPDMLTQVLTTSLAEAGFELAAMESYLDQVTHALRLQTPLDLATFTHLGLGEILRPLLAHDKTGAGAQGHALSHQGVVDAG
jgi:hypothetical protein